MGLTSKGEWFTGSSLIRSQRQGPPEGTLQGADLPSTGTRRLENHTLLSQKFLKPEMTVDLGEGTRLEPKTICIKKKNLRALENPTAENEAEGPMAREKDDIPVPKGLKDLFDILDPVIHSPFVQ